MKYSITKKFIEEEHLINKKSLLQIAKEAGCSYRTICRRCLDVHHIDYDKKNCKLNNLVALCKSCHMKTNYNRDYWKSLLQGA